MEEHVFFSGNGMKLCGILSTPTDDKSKVVILAHGLGRGKESWTCRRLQEILNEQGIATFRIDLYGHGESEGSFENVMVSKATKSVLSAAAFLRKQGFQNIGLYGASFGGLASVLASSNIKPFVLALKSPVSNIAAVEQEQLGDKGIHEWKKKGTRAENGRKLKYTFYKDSLKHSAYDAAKNIQTHTLIVHGDYDATVPVEQSEKLASLLPFGQLQIVEGADHKFSNEEHFEVMIDLISRFIIEHAVRL